MKKTYLLAILLFTAMVGMAKGDKKIASPRAYLKTENVTVSYGQPSMRGRQIFGVVVPYGYIWRAGANEATEITFKKDVLFAGHEVSAGTYTLFIFPKVRPERWHVILNKKTGQFGAFEYDKYKDQNIVDEEIETLPLNTPVEKFTITYDNENLLLEWEKTKMVVPLIVK